MTCQFPSGSSSVGRLALPLTWLTVLLGASLTTIGCGGTASGGTAGLLASMKPLEALCQGGPVDSYVALDGSRSGNDPDLVRARVATAYDAAMVSATCTGAVRVTAFSASTSDTVTLVELNFSKGAGTETSRRIRAGRAIKAAYADLDARLGITASKLDTGRTDVIPQLELAAQFRRQVRASRPSLPGRLQVVVATDGIVTAPGPSRMLPGPFTQADATKAAALVDIPKFGATTIVTFIGIGRLAASHKQPPSQFTAAITTFYARACRRTGAATCNVSTN